MIGAEDFFAISQVIYRYSYAMDHRRWDGMADVFIDDADIIFGETSYRGREKGVAVIRAFIECCSITHHMNSNLLVLSAERDTIRTVCNFRAWHRGKGDRGHEVVECLGTYIDEFRRGPRGWRIARRQEDSPIVMGDMDAFFSEAAALLADNAGGL